MDLLITPSKISGSVSIPPSKSLTHRYFILASLAKGTSQIVNPLLSDDTLYTLNALEKLGTKIFKKDNTVIIEGNNGNFNPNNNNIFLGDSGTSARLLISLASLSNESIIIDGSKRLRERPNKELLQVLEEQGIQIKYLEKKYHLPVEIYGNELKGGKIKIAGDISSQFISSLLIIAPFAQKDVEIKIIGEIKSKPYIDLTISAMNDFEVKVNKHNQSFFIKKGQQYKPQNIKVEGDYSSASYFIALSYLLDTYITIDNLNPKSYQADKAIIKFINNLKITNEFDISDCPDIALTLGVIGPFSKDYLILKGVNRLIAKECNRKEALINNLQKLGAKLETGEDYIKIFKSNLTGGLIETYNDHRVAMSFAILGTMIKTGIVIKNAQVVNKSYPNFFQDLKKIGVNVKEL